ncbi:MAG: mandelate racemase/muconate lactonizing enzyme family protein [Candidatus Lokiarchaeota archaeon]|nr:mandelate racemase/muconate lactonizing enzyme family protein [Candidatus Lokiarchaeota archaeon]
MSYKITGIELTPLQVPYQDFIQELVDRSEGGLGMAIPSDTTWPWEFIICKLYCNDGSIGLGEVFVWLPETGEIGDNIINLINKILSHYVIGTNPFDIEKILLKMDNNVTHNFVSKGLIDMAIYDLIGKLKNKPACDLISDKHMDKIPLACLIPLGDIETSIKSVETFKNLGYKTFRCKLGRNIEDDVFISETIRKLIGPEMKMRVDYNQAYTPEEAVKAIKAIEKFKIMVAEQPVNKNDFIGMAYVQKRVEVPLMAHEGFFSLQDFQVLVELGGIGVLGINSERPGGVTNALKALDYANKIGMKALVHNQCLGIASAMLIHLVAAKFDLFTHDTELMGNIMLKDDLIKKKIKYSNGFVHVPKGPGWGVELDEKALEKYATGPTTIIGKIS